MSPDVASDMPRFWGILFPEAYANTKRTLLRDWALVCTTMVVGVVGIALLFG